MENFGQWKFLCIGIAIGSVLTVIVGFGLGGWMTGNGANERGLEIARTEVTAALVPFCTRLARQDPKFDSISRQLRSATPMQGAREIMNAGWALNLTTGKQDIRLAYACLESLIAQR